MPTFIRRGLARAPWAVAAIALLVVFLYVLGPLVRGRLAPHWDADGYFAPFYTLVADFARQGRLLLWNPWASGGSPDFLDPQIGASSPVMVLSALLTGGGERGFRMHWLAVWFLGAVGILLLARRWRIPVLGAFVVALGFAFSGPFTGHASHTSWIHSFALLPLIVDRTEAAMSERRFLPAGQAGVLWGLSALGGYPAVVFAAAMFIALWILGRALCGGMVPGRPEFATPVNRSLRRSAALVALAGVLGLTVLIPSVAGMITEGRGYASRAEPLPREVAISSNALHPRGLATVFSPYLASLPAGKVWPYTDVTSVSVYLGTLPLFFAAAAIACRPRDKGRWWLLGMAVLFVSLSLGQELPMRGWLYDLVPVTRFFRHACVFRLPAVLCLVLLALAGVGDLSSRSLQRPSFVSLIVATGLLTGAAVWSYLDVSRMANTPAQASGDVHLAVMWAGVLVCCALFSAAPSGTIRLTTWGLVATLAIFDAHQTVALSTTVGSATTVAGWRQLDRARVRSLDLLAINAPERLAVSNDSNGLGPGPTNKNLVVKRQAFRGYPALTNATFERWAKTPALLARVLPDKRIYFAPEAITLGGAPSTDAAERFANHVVSSGRFPLVVEGSDAGQTALSTVALGSQLERAPEAQPIDVRWLTYDPDRLAIEFVAPASGWLLVTDRWAPGWAGTLDGRPIRIERADFLFRGVQVPAGRHTLQMTYRPWGYAWIVLASWAVTVLVCGVSAVAAFRAWRRPRGAAGSPAPSFQLDLTGTTS